eukprot:5563561-Alexandrium_andersonii.AAC.1
MQTPTAGIPAGHPMALVPTHAQGPLTAPPMASTQAPPPPAPAPAISAMPQQPSLQQAAPGTLPG